MLRLAIAGSLALVLVLGGVAWLTYGVEVQEKVLDRTGDLGLRNGYKPGERRVADIVSAGVSSRDETLVFEATMASVVPESISQGSLSVTWDIRGEPGWELQVFIGRAVNAFLLNKRTRSGFSIETAGFPGTVEIDGTTVIVVLEPESLEEFPRRFRWIIETELDVSLGQKGAGVVTDHAPDGRYGNFRL